VLFFPRLYQLDLWHYRVLGTLAAMERTFGAVGYVSVGRNRHGDNLAQQMVIAKCNDDIFHSHSGATVL